MKLLSLYSGAGGLDYGLTKAGFDVLWANDINKDACQTYKSNIGDHIFHGDISEIINDLSRFQDVDLVAGGPPCQGFSVAGKMNPDDPRSKEVWNFLKVVEISKAKAFLMENVKALGTLDKWKPLRNELIKKFKSLGYNCGFVIVNASDFDVPQNRERVLFIGFKANVLEEVSSLDLDSMLANYKIKSPILREVLQVLDRAGTGNNNSVCNAKITTTANPVLRKSPYAGMIFNGMGRPINLDGYSNTLPASMGGNKTPIIDDDNLYHNKLEWIKEYHNGISQGTIIPQYGLAPNRLRRLTIQEAALIQTFPIDYEWKGSQSSIFKQIGNAVPCNLALNIGKMIIDTLSNQNNLIVNNQLEILI
ncbi:DNA cytosine methyltransferase [Sphingobacterium sp. UBA6320]|uniref:DNA cytosine methyltransferase n=1 Tax=Sphingobacterium sp. UBA6320 TaxID=1947510 RepID=UPI0025E94CF3|nr:DNA cytosine methyltransferase [Sphingobacterium sp. UBA6320]